MLIASTPKGTLLLSSILILNILHINTLNLFSYCGIDMENIAVVINRRADLGW